VLDAAIVANAHAVEHYEIARYGTLITWAEELGYDDIVRFPQQISMRKRRPTPSSTP
jgi:ferritin-like metal-binding protein YciE